MRAPDSDEQPIIRGVVSLRTRYRHVGVVACLKSVRVSDMIWFCGQKPGHTGPCGGSLFAKKPLATGCNKTTTLTYERATDFALRAKYYTSGFCSYCQRHYGLHEFVWTEDGEEVGT